MPVIWLIGVILVGASVVMPSATERQEHRAWGTAVLGIAIVIVAAIMEFAT